MELVISSATVKMFQAPDSVPPLNCDPDMKQAAAVTLKVRHILKGTPGLRSLDPTGNRKSVRDFSHFGVGSISRLMLEVDRYMR